MNPEQSLDCFVARDNIIYNNKKKKHSLSFETASGAHLTKQRRNSKKPEMLPSTLRDRNE